MECTIMYFKYFDSRNENYALMTLQNMTTSHEYSIYETWRIHPKKFY